MQDPRPYPYPPCLQMSMAAVRWELLAAMIFDA